MDYWFIPLVILAVAGALAIITTVLLAYIEEDEESRQLLGRYHYWRELL